MRTRLLVGMITAAAVCAALAVVAAAGDQPSEDTAEILKLHEELIEAHKSGDVETLLSAEADRVMSVGRGEVSYSTKEERRPRFEGYLGSAEFEKYEDLIEPIVRVSDDGSLGWLICQVEIVGKRVNSEGETASLDSVWAWIELYEKKDGRWYRVGEVSNVKPRK